MSDALYFSLVVLGIGACVHLIQWLCVWLGILTIPGREPEGQALEDWFD